MPQGSEAVAWMPTPEYVENANVARLMQLYGVSTVDELRAATTADVARYWQTVVDDLGIPFTKPYEQVMDDSAGIKWTKWFTGGEINMTSVCVDRWADEPATADRPAVICQRETG